MWVHTAIRRFGTHHARDAFGVFETLGLELDLFSSAVKLNTQYMHSIWFELRLNRDIEMDEVSSRLAENHRVATTQKQEANLIFSFGRDHGYYGRILSQAVVVVPSLIVRGGREIVGFCFTPQDGNSLLSSVAASLWLMEPDWDDGDQATRAHAPLCFPRDLGAGSSHSVAIDSLSFGDLRIEGVSRAGEETWIRVHPPGLVFDVGRGATRLAGAADVFLTHGHLDHALGLPYVLSLRTLHNSQATRVFAPAAIGDGLEQLIGAAETLEGVEYDYEIQRLEPGDRIPVARDLSVEAFATDHILPSLGYHLRRAKKRLKSEYQGCSSRELADLKARGTDVEDPRDRKSGFPTVAIPGPGSSTWSLAFWSLLYF